MFRVKKYFHIRNQRVRISTKRIINRNFIIFLKKLKTSTGKSFVLPLTIVRVQVADWKRPLFQI